MDQALTYLLCVVIRDNRFELEDAIVLHRVKPPSLTKLRWRLDVIISTGSLNRVFVPQFLMEMRLSNGSIKSFYMTADQVQGLRFQVAKVLRAMQEVERHPIMRLAFEKDKLRDTNDDEEAKS